MKPITLDERQVVLARVVRDLSRLRTDATNVDCDFLAFLLANAQDEAQGQLERLESELSPEDS